MTYHEWAVRYPDAAQALLDVIGGNPPVPDDVTNNSEAWVQQQIRLKAAHAGAMAWRNNVGATPSRCPDCGAAQRPLRYGLANDSQKLNTEIKSSDLILAIPRQITPDMVGGVIAQFGSIEAKKPGWRYTGNKQETAQAAWLALINRLGGFAKFSTGDLKI